MGGVECGDSGCLFPPANVTRSIHAALYVLGSFNFICLMFFAG